MVNLPILALRAAGKRLPTLEGTLTVEGVSASIEIRRDRFGVPHIQAADDADAWFGVGFCHGQDRTFQIETRLRIVRGTLAALLGPAGLPPPRARPTPYRAADALGYMALFTFAMASNWDVELARLKILTLDGPEALAALDPAYPARPPASDRPGAARRRAP